MNELIISDEAKVAALDEINNDLKSKDFIRELGFHTQLAINEALAKQASIKQLNYSIALQRAIEAHCDNRNVPPHIAKECPFHAEKLNQTHEVFLKMCNDLSKQASARPNYGAKYGYLYGVLSSLKSRIDDDLKQVIDKALEKSETYGD